MSAKPIAHKLLTFPLDIIRYWDMVLSEFDAFISGADFCVWCYTGTKWSGTLKNRFLAHKVPKPSGPICSLTRNEVFQKNKYTPPLIL